MIKRFFKLLYIFALAAIGLSLPIFLLTTIQFDEIVITSYKAKCLSNNQYVVLQGSEYNKVFVFDELALKNPPLLKQFFGEDIQKKLNFYCKYYDEIQPYITAYQESKTTDEQMVANKNFVKFEENVISNVGSYPSLYKLEVVSEEMHLDAVYNPIIDWFIGAVLAFLLLQLIRICCVYVVFGKIVWHPFRQNKI